MHGMITIMVHFVKQGCATMEFCLCIFPSVGVNK